MRNAGREEYIVRMLDRANKKTERLESINFIFYDSIKGRVHSENVS